jgi:hypothetical protein
MRARHPTASLPLVTLDGRAKANGGG